MAKRTDRGELSARFRGQNTGMALCFVALILMFARVIKDIDRWIADQFWLGLGADFGDRQIDAVAGVGVERVEIAQIIAAVACLSDTRKHGESGEGNDDLSHNDGPLTI